MAIYTMTFEDALNALGGLDAILTEHQKQVSSAYPLKMPHSINNDGSVHWTNMSIQEIEYMFLIRFSDREIAQETLYSFARHFQRKWSEEYTSIATQSKLQIDLIAENYNQLLQREREQLDRTYTQHADSDNDRIYSDTPNEKISTSTEAGYYTDRTKTNTINNGNGDESYTRTRSDNPAEQYLKITKIFEDLNKKFLDKFEDLFLDFDIIDTLTLRTKRRF